MNIHDFKKLPHEWTELLMNDDYSHIDIDAFCHAKDIVLIMFHFDDLFVSSLLLSLRFEQMIDKLTQEGFYPVFNERLSYKKWTRQGVLFLNKDLVVNNDAVSKKIMTHLVNKKVIWLVSEKDKDQIPSGETVYTMETPLVFKKINEDLYTRGKHPISW